MTKNYQTKPTGVATVVETVMPDVVSVTLAELGGSMREGLLALAVGTGFQVMEAIIDESVTASAGPKGRHDPNRTAVRHGSEDGSVVLGGRRVPTRRPRVRWSHDGEETPAMAKRIALPRGTFWRNDDVRVAVVPRWVREGGADHMDRRCRSGCSGAPSWEWS